MKNNSINPQKQPLVSVLMTVYNREKYIAEAIESVLASSYTHFELIIVDDQSTDHSVEIARKYEQQDGRIKVFVNEKNLMQFQNRNKAASYTKGKYIKYLDSDDLIYPHGLQVMVEAMEQFPDAGIGFSSANYLHNQKYPLLISSEKAIEYHFLQKGFLYTGPTGAIYRADFFRQTKGFNPDFKVAADYEFNIRAALQKPIVLFQQDLFWWRQHGEQEIEKYRADYLALNYKIYEKHIFQNPKVKVANVVKQNTKIQYARKTYRALTQLKFADLKFLLKTANLRPINFIVALFPSKVRRWLL